MKKNLTKPVIAVLLGALTFSSCIGSFSLTNSVLNWNKSCLLYTSDAADEL